MPRPSAVIYLPRSDQDHWLARCLEHCRACGYVVIALVQEGDRDEGWRSVRRMIDTASVDVVVVGRRSHMPPDRQPRIEEAHEHCSDTGCRRPRLI